MTYRRALRFAAGLVILCLLAGCQTGEEGYIFKLDDEEIPVGVYIYWQVLATREALYLVPPDTTAATLWEQDIGGVAVEDWINAEALADTRRQIAAEILFDELGFDIDRINRAELDNWVGTQWQAVGEAHEKSGISRSSFYRVNESIAKQRRIFVSIYGAEGSSPIPEEEVVAHFREAYTRFSYMHFEKNAAAPNPAYAEQALSALRAEAGGLYARALGGENFYDLVDEYRGVARDAEKGDIDTRPFDSSYYYVATRTVFTGFPPGLIAQVFDTPIGGVDLYEDDDYIFVFQRQDPMQNESDYSYLEFNLRYGIKGDAFDRMLSDKADELSLRQSDAAIKKFMPRKLNLSSI